jgi:uncharacterized protein (DUF58 family)
VPDTLRLIREALYYQPQGKGTNITEALQYLNEVWRRKAVVFLISDFEDTQFEPALKVTARRHDLIAVRIQDPRETDIPSIGLIELQDAETGEPVIIDTSDRIFMEEYRRRKIESAATVSRLFRKANIDTITISTGIPYIKPLIQFFKQREKRQAH